MTTKPVTHSELTKEDRAQLVERIGEHVEALTRPTTTRETQRTWDEDRQRFGGRVHVVEHPPLLVQLAQSVEGTTGPSTSSGSFESKPAARLDAIATLEWIRAGARQWVRDVVGERPGSVAWNLQLLAARAHVLSDVELAGDPEDRKARPGLERTLFRWVATARVTTGWDSPAWAPHAPCMVCATVGRLRIRVAPMTAVCLECRSVWDASTIGVLGNHVQIMLNAAEHPIETADSPASKS